MPHKILKAAPGHYHSTTKAHAGGHAKGVHSHGHGPMHASPKPVHGAPPLHGKKHEDGHAKARVGGHAKHKIKRTAHGGY